MLFKWPGMAIAFYLDLSRTNILNHSIVKEQPGVKSDRPVAIKRTEAYQDFVGMECYNALDVSRFYPARLGFAAVL